jgi:signal peptidase II
VADSTGVPSAGHADTGRLARVLAIVAIVVVTIGCDRVTKQVAARRLAGHPRISLASDVIRVEYAENRGGFLSLGADLPDELRTGIFSLGTALLLAGVGVWVCRQALSGRPVLGPALLWAGGMANLADRLWGGRVIDFLNLGVGPLRTGIFNVADVAITLGVSVIVWGMARPATRRRV